MRIGIVLVLLTVGCGGAEPTTYSDSLGVTYERVGARWELAADAPPALVCDGSGPAVVGTWGGGGGHVTLVCAYRPSGTLDATTCRPILCPDGVCPSSPGIEIVCDSGYCTQPVYDWEPADVIAVCLAAEPRFTACEDTTASLSHLAMVGAVVDAHCVDGVCSRPTDCLD